MVALVLRLCKRKVRPAFSRFLTTFKRLWESHAKINIKQGSLSISWNLNHFTSLIFVVIELLDNFLEVVEHQGSLDETNLCCAPYYVGPSRI